MQPAPAAPDYLAIDSLASDLCFTGLFTGLHLDCLRCCRGHLSMTPAEIHDRITAQRRNELRPLRLEKIWLLLALHMISGQSVLLLVQQSAIANRQSPIGNLKF